MDITKQIAKQKQIVCREEKLLMVEKLKKRRDETRRKIELGGLVVKSGMDAYNKAIILGALDYIQKQILDSDLVKLLEERGNLLFIKNAT
ncbi:conjugal transfer protein TraD [Legionella quinlivanii]|uniref:Conjugal transfer protein TraD n=1 Tax=Legionella quinlivanii TaxID=45073 RepID=A0A364LJK3_9GAMM|nr:conjugal transfer protein TraD [Legionella quinlivanii]RAP36675.1 conjugal transfer protein TraD [Legionella quinlivanii]